MNTDLFKNPWVIGGIGVVLLVVILGSAKGGSNGNAAAVSAATANSANNTNVALAQLTTSQNVAQLQANSVNYQTTMASEISALAQAFGFASHIDDNNSALQAGQQQTIGGIVNNSITTNALLSEDKLNAALKLQLAPIEAQTTTQLAQISANTTTNIAQIETANAQALASINASAAEAIASIRSGGSGTSTGSSLSDASTALSLIGTVAAFF